jgi:hypothetical protein
LGVVFEGKLPAYYLNTAHSVAASVRPPAPPPTPPSPLPPLSRPVVALLCA